MCLNPKKIRKEGHYKESNYRGVEGEYYSINTYSKCGCCTQCINEKNNNWVVRNAYEQKAHTKKCFISLTYKENPIIIVRKDLQDFMKRLRWHLNKYENGAKIRMFGNMEYGELHNRPHGHVILYGWDDLNAEYLTINKKGNIIMKSNLINEIWGHGRTSYQDFGENEIPYISLYSTPQETFKKGYKMTREKLKTLMKYAESKYKGNEASRNNLIKELIETEKELEEEKKKYMLIKEFNTWSIALGWEEFQKEYYKSQKYTFKEYFWGSEFATPSPWVKKLANAGCIDAKEEMLKREQEIIEAMTEQDERNRNLMREFKKKEQEIMDWNRQKDKITVL